MPSSCCSSCCGSKKSAPTKAKPNTTTAESKQSDESADDPGKQALVSFNLKGDLKGQPSSGQQSPHRIKDTREGPPLGDGRSINIKYHRHWYVVPLPFWEENLSDEDKKKYKDFDFSRGSDCGQYLLDKLAITEDNMHRHGYYLKRGKHKDRFYEDDLPEIFGAKPSKRERHKKRMERLGMMTDDDGAIVTNGDGDAAASPRGNPRASPRGPDSHRTPDNARGPNSPRGLDQGSTDSFTGRKHLHVSYSDAALELRAQSLLSKIQQGADEVNISGVVAGDSSAYSSYDSSPAKFSAETSPTKLDGAANPMKLDASGAFFLPSKFPSASTDASAKTMSATANAINSPTKYTFGTPLLCSRAAAKAKRKNKQFDLVPAIGSDMVAENIHRNRDRRLKVFVNGGQHAEVQQGITWMKKGFRVYWVNDRFPKPRLRYFQLSECSNYLLCFLDADDEDDNDEIKEEIQEDPATERDNEIININSRKPVEKDVKMVCSGRGSVLEQTNTALNTAVSTATDYYQSAKETAQQVQSNIKHLRSEISWSHIGPVVFVCKTGLQYAGIGRHTELEPLESIKLGGEHTKLSLGQSTKSWQDRFINGDIQTYQQVDDLSFSIEFYSAEDFCYKTLDCVARNEREYDIICGTLLGCMFEENGEKVSKAVIWEHSKRFQKATEPTEVGSRPLRSEFYSVIFPHIAYENEVQLPDILFAPISDIMEKTLASLEEMCKSETDKDVEKQRRKELQQIEQENSMPSLLQVKPLVIIKEWVKPLVEEYIKPIHKWLEKTNGSDSDGLPITKENSNVTKNSNSKLSPMNLPMNLKGSKGFPAEAGIKRSSKHAERRESHIIAKKNIMLPIESGIQYQIAAFEKGLDKVEEKSKKVFRGYQDYKCEETCRNLALNECRAQLDIVAKERMLLMAELKSRNQKQKGMFGTFSPTTKFNRLSEISPTESSVSPTKFSPSTKPQVSFGSRMKLAVALWRAASELENVKIFYGRARLNLKMKPDELMRTDLGFITPFLGGKHHKTKILGYCGE